MNKWTFHTALAGRQNATTTLGISRHDPVQSKMCTHRTQNFHSRVDTTLKLLQGNIQKNVHETRCGIGKPANKLKVCQEANWNGTQFSMSPLEFPHILSTEALTASVLVCVFKGVAQWTASEDKDHVSLWSGLGRLAYCPLQKTRIF